MKKTLFISFCIAFLLSTSVFSQDIEEQHDIQPFQLKGTHSISLHAGLQDFESYLAYTSGKITATHFIGFLSYQYWYKNNSSLSFSVGMLEHETHVRFSGTFTKTTIPLVIGLNFYPNSLYWGNIGRGYFGLNVGTYLETTSGVRLDTGNFGAGTKTEVKPGADLHAGLDFFPSKSIRIGPQLAWYSSEHFKGVAVSLTLGALFKD